jgi:hypothetical protein
MDSAGDLCRDAIYEVLTRSSMEIVGKCRLLSKEYNKLTYESLFTRLHNQKTNIVSYFLITSMIRNGYQVSFVSTNAVKTPIRKYPLIFFQSTWRLCHQQIKFYFVAHIINHVIMCVSLQSNNGKRSLTQRHDMIL